MVKIGNQSTSRPTYTNLGHISQGYLIITQGHLLSHVHSSVIHDSHNLERTWMPLNQRMDKKNMVPLYNGVLLSCKKGRMKFAGKWMKLEKNYSQ